MKKHHKNLSHKSLVFLVTCLALFAFTSLFYQIINQGIQHWPSDFLTSLPKDGGRAGGIYPIILSSFLILVCCMVFAVPLGLGCAIHLYLQQHEKKLSRSFLLICSDLLASIPSIIYGLLGATLFCDILNLGYSILSGGLTLACMILPLFIRLNDQIFKNIPESWQQAAYNLGLSQWRFLFQIILPRFLPQISGALILCLGRALAETAALLFTSGYVLRTPVSIFDSGRSLSVHIYELAMNLPGGDGPAAASALFLFIILLSSTSLAQLLSKNDLRFKN